MRYLFYQGSITHFGVANTQTLINDAYRSGVKDLTLCLCTSGGDVTSGIGLFNFIRMFDVNINTHAAGICESIGVTILLAGKVRTATPTSVFSTHQASYSEGPLKGQRSANTDLICAPFAEVAGWNPADIEERFSDIDFRFDPHKAVEYGVIHRVMLPTIGDGDEMVNIKTIPDR